MLTLQSSQGSNSNSNSNNNSNNQNGSSSSTSTQSTTWDFGSNGSKDDKGTMPDDSRANGTDPDNILNSQYARARRELLELVRDLRALGYVIRAFYLIDFTGF